LHIFVLDRIEPLVAQRPHPMHAEGSSPSLQLLDEPSTSLDEQNQ
jgi:hypothetical protein